MEGVYRFYDSKLASRVAASSSPAPATRVDGASPPPNADAPGTADTASIILRDLLAGIKGEDGKPYFQGTGDKRGAISFLPSGKMLIQLFDKADLSTVLHETGHLFLEVMGDLATAENAPAALKAEYAKAPPLTRGSTPSTPTTPGR